MPARRVAPDQVDAEVAALAEVMDPPAPVWVWLTGECQQVAAALIGWPAGRERALVQTCALGVFWVRAEHVRARQAA